MSLSVRSGKEPMKITITRRFGAALLAPALAAGMVLAAPAAQAGPETDAASTWLAAQLGNVEATPDLFTSYYQGDDGPVAFTDYGLNLDLYAALAKFGSADAAERVYDATIAKADDYIDAFGTRFAGAAGKLAAMVRSHGDDPSNVDGRDVIADIQALVVTEGTATGRAKDDSDFADSSNSIGQAWVLRALANEGEGLDDEVADYLLKQQCADGSFRLLMSDVACTTGSGSAEVTSFAVQALDVAGEEGVGDFDAEVAAAITWLVAEQGADGSFSDEGSGVANTNSTGLAAVALQAHDRSGAAASAAGWIAKHQVAASNPEAGAIALNAADLAAAKGVEIGQVNRDRYVRASVQAALGLDALLPDTSATVTRSAQFVSAGKSAAISATGFEPGEKVSFAMAGATTVRRTADANGKAIGSITTPKTSGTRTVSVQGSTAGRGGSVKVTVLAARKLSVTPRYTSVKAGKSQNVFVKGLTKDEPVKVYYQRKRIKVGVAKADGTFSYTFKVGKSKGKKTVRVNGAFTNRTNSKTFTVR